MSRARHSSRCGPSGRACHCGCQVDELNRSSPVLVLGASAGGVEALQTLVKGLPADFDAAVFVVLHIPADTPSELRPILQRVSALPVVTPNDNDPIRAGHIYVAKPDRHLVVEYGRIRISPAPKECRARPSINVLFRSAAAAYGPRVIGVVLTGMRDDGTSGLWAIKEAGGVALVQDPGSAKFPAMPQSALHHVQVDAVLPMDALAGEVCRRASSQSACRRSETSCLARSRRACWRAARSRCYWSPNEADDGCAGPGCSLRVERPLTGTNRMR
jgi:chemotaxis response regulator CheB